MLYTLEIYYYYISTIYGLMATNILFVFDIFIIIAGIVQTEKCSYTVDYYDSILKTTSQKRTSTYCQTGYRCCEQVQTKCCKIKETKNEQDNNEDTGSSFNLGPTFISVLSVILGCIFGILIFITFIVLIRRICCKDITKKPKPRSTTTREVKGRRAVYIYKARFPKGEKPVQQKQSVVEKMIEKKKTKTTGIENEGFSDDEDKNSSFRSTASSPAYSNMNQNTSYTSYHHVDGRVVYVASSPDIKDRIFEEEEDGYMSINDETRDYLTPRTARSNTSINFADESDCSSHYGGSSSSIEVHTRGQNANGSSTSLQSGRHRKMSDVKCNPYDDATSLQSKTQQQSKNINGSTTSLQSYKRRISSTSETGITFTTTRTHSCVSLSSQCQQDLPMDIGTTARCSSPVPDTDIQGTLPILETVDLYIQKLKEERKDDKEASGSDVGNKAYEELRGREASDVYEKLDNEDNVESSQKNIKTEKMKLVNRSAGDMSIFLAKSSTKDENEDMEPFSKNKKKKNLFQKLVVSKSSPSLNHQKTALEKSEDVGMPYSPRGSSSSADDEESSAGNEEDHNSSAWLSQTGAYKGKRITKKGKKRRASKNIDIGLTPTINEEDIDEHVQVSTKRSLSLPVEEQNMPNKQYPPVFTKRPFSVPTTPLAIQNMSYSDLKNSDDREYFELDDPKPKEIQDSVA